MKKIKSLLLLIAFATITCLPLLAQDPPPPPSGGHGQSGNQSPPGGGTPVGAGLVILLTLGAAYGGKKWVTLYEVQRWKK